MNIIKHRVYKLEFDVWEPTEKKLNEQMDRLVASVRQVLGHAGYVRLVLESEERL